MADVAKRAGVSSQTVSRVSNGHPGVIPATREVVQAAMRELGYRPNSAARALKWGSFRTIGVILFSLANVGNSKTLEGIAAEATARGYGITLIPVAMPTEAAVIGAFGRLEELAVDAVIVIMEIHLLDAATVGLPPGAPVVVVDSNAGDRYPVVDTDQSRGGQLAVEHLLSLGHETVWHVAGPEESFASERRLAAWRETLTAAGKDVPRVLRGDWSAESGYAAGKELLAEESVTAVFVANDQMALGLMNALHEGGRRVPEDVSVVGFDDLPDSAAYLPPLTTIHQDFAEVGRLCVEGALDQVDNGASQPGVTLVPTRLVVRASTGSPPRRD
ncbi:LacI family DNA-binding transcriptional regulator [Aeromicrobium sp. 9AM]|uniref:LacI family DNA-binding transcriptional regulator n=1 Tax=Aeromicrobium sp. 9AM TaxID=2653126 RepID=UPI0012EFE871|nr:LacI family DNA-binding transcriptional regulator [Aeromicrobium sp. 9AM]VXB38709.1 LacI family transcriptional regulator [Aeromicrobium sp. 9AM]